MPRPHGVCPIRAVSSSDMPTVRNSSSVCPSPTMPSAPYSASVRVTAASTMPRSTSGSSSPRPRLITASSRPRIRSGRLGCGQFPWPGPAAGAAPRPAPRPVTGHEAPGAAEWAPGEWGTGHAASVIGVPLSGAGFRRPGRRSPAHRGGWDRSTGGQFTAAVGPVPRGPKTPVPPVRTRRRAPGHGAARASRAGGRPSYAPARPAADRPPGTPRDRADRPCAGGTHRPRRRCPPAPPRGAPRPLETGAAPDQHGAAGRVGSVPRVIADLPGRIPVAPSRPRADGCGGVLGEPHELEDTVRWTQRNRRAARPPPHRAPRPPTAGSRTSRTRCPGRADGRRATRGAGSSSHGSPRPTTSRSAPSTSSPPSPSS